MNIKYIGTNINKETIIEQTYKIPQNRKGVKICEETDFKKGFLTYEDGVFLPHGTYVLLKEDGKEDKIGRIFHYYINENEDGIRAAIVDVHYDMNSSRDRLQLNDKFIIGFIYKSMYGLNRNKNKFLQVISYEETNDDVWSFVKLEYGNPGVKMFYKYGWQYYNGEIYAQKDTASKKIILNKPYPAVYIYNTCPKNNINTDVEYAIKPSVTLVPYEQELIIAYIISMGITFIFTQRLLFWTIFTILFVAIRKNLRNKYNG